MNSDSYLYFNIAQEIRLYINSTMKHQLKFYIVLFFIQLFPCAFAQQMSVSTLPLNNYLPSSTVLRVHCDREVKTVCVGMMAIDYLFSVLD